MKHIGIDLGATHSHIVIASAGGKSTRTKVRTGELPQWLGRQPPSRVVMEACTQSPAVASAARMANHDVRVISGQLVRALGVGARGIKTDERDANVLAKASMQIEDLPSVHVRTESSTNHRGLLASRALLLKARRSISLSVKSWLRSRLVQLRGRADRLAFTEAVRGVALEHPDGLPSHIEALLRSFESLTEEIEKLDLQIKAIADADSVCSRMQTIPGVGPIVSLAMKTQLDDPGRFPSANDVASYLALVPGECTTGDKIKRTSTIKAGPRHLKGLLVQAAWSMWRSRPRDPVVAWARAIADKRGKRIAIVALARKIATISWSMWKHGTNYDPMKAAAPRPDPQTEESPRAVSG